MGSLNGVYRYEDRAPPMDITLTLDAELCARAYRLWKQKRSQVFNYKTGDILCMVSSPSFDPKALRIWRRIQGNMKSLFKQVSFGLLYSSSYI